MGTRSCYSQPDRSPFVAFGRSRLLLVTRLSRCDLLPQHFHSKPVHVYVYEYVYECAYMYVYVPVYVYVYMYAYMYVNVYAHAYSYRYVRALLNVHA